MWHLRFFLYPLLILSLGLSLSANGALRDPLPRQIQQTFGRGQLQAAFWLPDGRLLAQSNQGPRLYDLWFRELGAPAAWGPDLDWISQSGPYFLTQGPQGLRWWDWPAGAAEPTPLGQTEGTYQGGAIRPDPPFCWGRIARPCGPWPGMQPGTSWPVQIIVGKCLFLGGIP
jgi:hypothetical protein